MSSFYLRDELEKMGFCSLGQNIMLSRKASVYGAENIVIGNNVRIDDFCILSGNIKLGNYIHISPYVGLFGGEVGIEIMDYGSVSSRSVIYAITDDYNGEGMANPMVPEKYRKVYQKKVILKKHCLIGTGSTILPGVVLGEGVSIGAMSLVNKNVDAWTVNVGIPCRTIRERSKKILEYEKDVIGEVKK